MPNEPSIIKRIHEPNAYFLIKKLLERGSKSTHYIKFDIVAKPKCILGNSTPNEPLTTTRGRTQLIAII